MMDRVRSWLICLVPRFVCSWLWNLDVPLGYWAPHVLGRVLGVAGQRVDRKLQNKGAAEMRCEFEMTQEQLDRILSASKSVPYIAVQCGRPRSPQENANSAWADLGKEMGFRHMTVQPGKGDRFFTAEPNGPGLT